MAGRHCGSRLRTLAGAALLASAGILAAGCGPTITMPDVVGMRLDDAHRTLEALEVTEFEDSDVVGEKDMIWLDGNWVVVAQEPAAGTPDVDTGTTITLSVGNEDEVKEVLKLIPDDSAFAREVAAQRSEDAAEAKRERDEAAAEAREEAEQKAEEEAAERVERRADAREYATKIDKALAHNTRGVMRLYNKNAAMVRENGGGNAVAAGNALGAQEYFDQSIILLTSLDVAAPDSLDLPDVDDQMRDAMASMSLACDSLLDAIDTGAPSAFAREDRLRADAVESWNGAMRAVYGAADRRPVLIPAGP